MSQENVEIVKRSLDAFNRRDIEAGVAVVTADFEWFPAMAEAVEGGVYRGRKAVEAYFADLGKRRGIGSGVPVDAPLGLVYEMRGSKVSRARGYLDHAKALRAVGLEE
jgi:ketosteroid isomerase-like protein